ncbi:hypothetical protein IQ07DRAFT_643378 [Pyrenochaeta sp. DS3sAY3a]|nr:hypothetical protein IQ07DRAFT_643378 [Pyrenochaeta sp. DS3sAY3a]
MHSSGVASPPEDRGGDFYDGRYDGRSGARSRPPRRDDNENSSRDRRGSNDHGRRGRNSATPPEDDRDKRTIFVQRISQRARTIHLREFFEQVGTVIEAQIVKDRVKDRVTGRTKGVRGSWVLPKVRRKGLGEPMTKAVLLAAQLLGLMAHPSTASTLVLLPSVCRKDLGEDEDAGGGQPHHCPTHRSRKEPRSVAAGANGAPFHHLYPIQKLVGQWFCQVSVEKTLETTGQVHARVNGKPPATIWNHTQNYQGLSFDNLGTTTRVTGAQLKKLVAVETMQEGMCSTGNFLFTGEGNNQMIKSFMDCLGWPTEKTLKRYPEQFVLTHFEYGAQLRFKEIKETQRRPERCQWGFRPR